MLLLLLLSRCPAIDLSRGAAPSFHNTSSMDRTIGVSPFVGGLRGSAISPGRPKGKKGSRGNMVSRGENKPSLGVGGTSTKRRPA